MTNHGCNHVAISPAGVTDTWIYRMVSGKKTPKSAKSVYYMFHDMYIARNANTEVWQVAEPDKDHRMPHGWDSTPKCPMGLLKPTVQFWIRNSLLTVDAGSCWINPISQQLFDIHIQNHRITPWIPWQLYQLIVDHAKPRLATVAVSAPLRVRDR